MPVIRIPDTVYQRLQKHATPFVDTPATVIEMLLNAYEAQQSEGFPGTGAPRSRSPQRSGKGKEMRKTARAGQERSWEVPSGHMTIPCYTRLSTKWDDGRFERVTIFRYSLAQVVRALGREGYTVDRVRRLMDALELEDVRIKSIRTWVTKCGEDPAAKLTPEQLAAFDRLAPI